MQHFLLWMRPDEEWGKWIVHLQGSTQVKKPVSKFGRGHNAIQNAYEAIQFLPSAHVASRPSSCFTMESTNFFISVFSAVGWAKAERCLVPDLPMEQYTSNIINARISYWSCGLWDHYGVLKSFTIFWWASKLIFKLLLHSKTKQISGQKIWKSVLNLFRLIFSCFILSK